MDGVLPYGALMERRFQGLESLAIKQRRRAGTDVTPPSTPGRASRASRSPRSPGSPETPSRAPSTADEGPRGRQRSASAPTAVAGGSALEDAASWFNLKSLASLFDAAGQRGAAGAAAADSPRAPFHDSRHVRRWQVASDLVVRVARGWLVRRRTQRRMAVLRAQRKWRRAKEDAAAKVVTRFVRTRSQSNDDSGDESLDNLPRSSVISMDPEDAPAALGDGAGANEGGPEPHVERPVGILKSKTQLEKRRASVAPDDGAHGAQRKNSFATTHGYGRATVKTLRAPERTIR